MKNMATQNNGDKANPFIIQTREPSPNTSVDPWSIPPNTFIKRTKLFFILCLQMLFGLQVFFHIFHEILVVHFY